MMIKQCVWCIRVVCDILKEMPSCQVILWPSNILTSTCSKSWATLSSAWPVLLIVVQWMLISFLTVKHLFLNTDYQSSFLLFFNFYSYMSWNKKRNSKWNYVYVHIFNSDKKRTISVLCWRFIYVGCMVLTFVEAVKVSALAFLPCFSWFRLKRFLQTKRNLQNMEPDFKSESNFHLK